MRRQTLAACLILSLIWVAESYGQAKDQKLLAPVPAQYRTRLIERLRLYVESARRHQFESLYDLYDEHTLTTVERGESKAEYVKGVGKRKPKALMSPFLNLRRKV